MRCWRPARCPAGWARATRCGSRSATRSTATTCRSSTPRSRRGWAGCVRWTRRSSPAPRRCAASARPARPNGWRAFTSCESAASPGQGMAIVPDGEVTSGTMSPSLGIGIGMGYVPAGVAQPGTVIEIDVRGRPLEAEIARKPLYTKETTHERRQLPRRAALQRGARLGRASTATPQPSASPGMRRTRWARSSTSAPRRWAAASAEGGEYGELESTKAVSTLIAPLSGEVIEVNDALEGSESTVNDDPYGEGWLVKVRMGDLGRARLADGRGRLPGATWTRCELHLADRVRPGPDAGDDRRVLDRGAVRRHPPGAAAAAATSTSARR